MELKLDDQFDDRLSVVNIGEQIDGNRPQPIVRGQYISDEKLEEGRRI